MNTVSDATWSQLLTSHLVGALVQQVKCGPGTGSIFTLHLRNEAGTCYLMVFCSWKLLQEGTITCSWRDPETYIEEVLSAIKGLRLLRVSLAIGGDLVIELETGGWLHLFSDSAVPEDRTVESDYFVQVGDLIYTCLRGKLYREQVEK
jgi:hypothetical protein